MHTQEGVHECSSGVQKFAVAWAAGKLSDDHSHGQPHSDMNTHFVLYVEAPCTPLQGSLPGNSSFPLSVGREEEGSGKPRTITSKN